MQRYDVGERGEYQDSPHDPVRRNRDPQLLAAGAQPARQLEQDPDARTVEVHGAGEVEHEARAVLGRTPEQLFEDRLDVGRVDLALHLTDRDGRIDASDHVHETRGATHREEFIPHQRAPHPHFGALFAPAGLEFVHEASHEAEPPTARTGRLALPPTAVAHRHRQIPVPRSAASSSNQPSAGP